MTIKMYFLTLFLAVAITGLKAQTTRLPENVFQQKLPNGLTVIVIEDNSVPLVTVSMTFKNGGYTEPLTYSGLTYIYHNMMFKGNTVMGPGDAVAYLTSRFGMVRNLSVDEEVAENHITMPSTVVDQGLQYMNAAVRHTSFDEKNLNAARAVSEKELQGKESNPMFLLNKAMWQHLWGDMYRRKMAIGTHESIQQATVSMIDTIHQRYYYPNNAALIIAGNVTHQKMMEKAAEIFGSWPASPFNAFKQWPVPPIAPVAHTQYFTVENSNANVPYILISWQGPSSSSDVASTYAADVFSNVLTQNSSALKKALIQSGLAVDVNFNYKTLSQRGPITFLIKPNPLKIKECLAEVKKQMEQFDNDGYITAEQIAAAERRLEIEQIRQEEVTSDLVNHLSFWWATVSIDYYYTYITNLQKVNKASLQAYVRKYIKNKPYCAGLLISPQLKAQLKTDEFFRSN